MIYFLICWINRISVITGLAVLPDDYQLTQHKPLNLHCESKKTRHLTLAHNFTKYLPIFKIHPTYNKHTFNGPLSGTTQVSRYQKGKSNLDFTEANDSEWQWHLLGRKQVCTSLQTDNHASTPPLRFFTGRMRFLPRKKQRQSTEGSLHTTKYV